MYLHFVSHTHWDREWYETFDAFRFRLVRLIDRLLDILHKDPGYRHFLLDGQTIVLEDYLAIKPCRKDEIAKFIKEGRILIGPWYVLTDEFLVSGETHIRNLLFGKRLMQEFGGQNSVGYLPDSFGHIAQMPQILRKSGIRYATFWRGASREVTKSEFIWKAPDGSGVLTIYMPFGYGIAANLPSSREELLQRIQGVIEKLTPFATTSHLLLMNGSDHIEPDSELPKKLAILREELQEHVILHSSLPYLFRRVEEEAALLPVYEGEWRADDMNYLLGGTLSTRIYLKQKHTRLSYLIERYVEPLYTFLALSGIPYPEDFLNYLWKLLLENSPHDSICGCGIDAIHEEMMQRYRKIEDVASKLLKEARKHLESLCEGGEDVLVIFNPYPYPVSTYLEAEVYLKKSKVQEVDFAISKIRSYDVNEEPLAPALELIHQGETIVPEILESSWVTFMETPAHTLPEIFKAQRYVIGFPVRNLPPLGCAFFKITPREHKPDEPALSPPEEWLLENEFYRLRIDSRGCIMLYAKETQEEFLLGPIFEDGADAGDEYDYSPCAEDTILRSDTVMPDIQWTRYDRYVQSVRITHVLHLPKALAPDRKRRSEEKVSLPITTEVRLIQGSRRIDFTVTLENRALDHRLRVLFFAPFTTDHHLADTHFALLKRKNEQKTQPQNDFVLLENGKRVFGIFNEGLREYEIIPSKEHTCVAITLLRAVGWLSRDDLLTRKGHAGWGLPAEGAQCQGTYQFRLGALFTHRKTLESYSIYKEARLFNNPPLVFQIQSTVNHPLNGWSSCACGNEEVVLSALKKKEGGGDIVLRVYNPTDRPQDFDVTLNFPVLEIWQLSLLEEEQTLLAIQKNTIHGSLKPYEIATFGIVWKTRKEETHDP